MRPFLFARRKFLCLMLVATVLLSFPIRPAEAGKRYALVVGVKKYRSNQPLPELAYTENDATEFAKLLKQGGYDVTLMTQTEGRMDGKDVFLPTASYIRDQIDAILGSQFLKSDDLVLVALTGHGVQYELTSGDKKTGKFYFCPADADVSKLKSAKEITAANNLLDLAELYQNLERCKAGGKLLLVDACRNDPTKPSLVRSTSSVTLPPLPPPPGGIAAYFSCSAHEQAIEDQDLKHGVFFHHIIEGLQGDADAGTAKRPADGEITLAELSEHVGRGTYDFVRRKYQGYKQTPELRGEFRVSIPLFKLPMATAKKPEDVPTPNTFASSTSKLGERQILIMEGVPFASGTGKPGERRILIMEGVPFAFRRIPPTTALPGKFMMGTSASEASHEDDEAQVHVTLTQGYWMLETEVTQAMYFAVMQNRPWQGKEDVKEGAAFPASYINWKEASQFCEKLTLAAHVAKILSAKERIALPTEAQWEWAARAGTTTAYISGNEDSKLGEFAWYDENALAIGEIYPHQVGLKKPNAWGLQDISGNLLEWCSDNYGGTLAGGTDPTGASAASSRVLRGGSFGSLASDCRVGYRNHDDPTLVRDSFGFRVVCVSE